MFINTKQYINIFKSNRIRYVNMRLLYLLKKKVIDAYEMVTIYI